MHRLAAGQAAGHTAGMGERRARGKRSEAELRRLIVGAVAEACHLPRPGLWLSVDRVEAVGRPPDRLRVWATLHFLPDGSPFCCGEPMCQLGLFGDRLTAVGEHIRRAMGLRQPVEVEFGNRIAVRYHPGVTFTGEGPAIFIRENLE